MNQVSEDHGKERDVNQVLRRLSVAALLLLVLTLAAPMIVAEDTAEAEKQGAEILDKYIEVTGGLAAYDKINNRYTKGTFEMPAMDLKMDLEIWAARPNLFLSRIASPELGEMLRGYDGETFWENSMMSGPRILEGTELAEAVLEAQFESMVYWRDYYTKCVFAGEDSVGEILCSRVVLTSPSGNDRTLFFDQKSNLIVRLDAEIEHQMGTFPAITYLEDYREIDGIMMAFSTRIEVMQQVQQITADSVAHNVELAEGLFDLPDEIKELLVVPDTTKKGE